MPVFTQHFRVLRYDMRGHGGSPHPPGPYILREMAEDVLDVLDAYGIQQAHFCGISLGGMIGQWLGIHAKNRIDRLILCNTAAKIGTEEAWDRRLAEVGARGMASVADTVLSRWLTLPYVSANPEMAALLRGTLVSCDPAGYSAACAALQGADLRDAIHRIVAPTLILAGNADFVCTAEDTEYLAAGIRGSHLVTLQAAHLSNVEASDAFNAAVLEFLLQ